MGRGVRKSLVLRDASLSNNLPPLFGPAEEGANEEGGFKKRRMRALASKEPTGVDVFIQEQWSKMHYYEEDPDWERKWDELSEKEQGVYCYRAWRLSVPDAEVLKDLVHEWFY